MTKISIACATALALLAAPAAHAAVLLDQSFNPGAVQDGANFNDGSPALWDNFSVGAATAVSYVETWGSHWESGVIPADESFTVHINQYAGPGVLGAAVGVSATTQLSRIDTGFDHNDNGLADIFRYSLTLDAPIAIGPGAYWISIVRDVNGSAGTRWTWQRLQSNDGDQINASNKDLAVLVADAVPVADVPLPASALLLLGGVAGLGALRRRRA